MCGKNYYMLKAFNNMEVNDMSLASFFKGIGKAIVKGAKAIFSFMTGTSVAAKIVRVTVGVAIPVALAAVEIVKTIKDEGVIEEKESAFIQKAVILKRLRVQNIMISKENVSYLYDTDSSFKVRKCIFRDHHDRIPIITKDNKIVGILYEVALLDEILNDGTISIKRNVKEPVTVSMNTNLASCLEVLHGARAHMALVTDRENNFLGIVTMEDIINELMKS